MRWWAVRWLVVAALLAGCSTSERFTLGDPPRGVDLPEVAAVSDLTFPVDAELLSGRYSRFQEWHLSARVRVRSLSDFLSGNGLPEPAPVQGSFRNPASDADPDWHPDAATAVTPADTDVHRQLRFVPDGASTVVYVLVADV